MEHTRASDEGSILVWAEDPATALPLLRMARRKARELGVPWEVVHIETRHRTNPDDPESRQALATLAVAEQMGARTTHILARQAPQGIARLLAERQENGNPVQLLLLMDRPTTGWRKWLGHSSSDAFARLPNAPKILTVESGQQMVAQAPEWLSIFKVSLIEIINCIMAVAVATALIQMIDLLIPETITSRDYNKPIIYMIACAFAAGRYGLFAGIFTALISFITYNLMYVSVDMHLAINSPADAVNLGLYFVAALVISFFTSQTFSQREKYAARAQRVHALFQLHRVAMDRYTRAEAIEALHDELTTILDTEVVFFLPSALNPKQLEPACPADTELTELEQQALDLCWQESTPSGIGSPNFPEVNWRFVPLITSQGEIGVLAMHIDDIQRFDIPSGRLLGAVADQIALIIERFELDQAMEETRLRDEREKLRSMLLSSVSHDLKTPLASVIGALSVYQTMGATLSDEHRTTLITTALEEAQRLDSFITNILDMTRLESGGIEFKKEWVSPEDIFRKVERRMKNRMRNHVLVVQGTKDAAEILIDPTSLEQVMSNLLDNAAKYTPPTTRIELQGYPDGQHYIVQLRDHGDGIPDGKLDQIFDKYARLKRADSQVAGTGLGLAICRSVLQTQGGTIEAANHPQGGAVFTLTFPQWRRPRADRSEDAA